jgi:hypothetical protein
MKILGFIILALAGILSFLDLVTIKVFFGLYGLGTWFLFFGYLESYEDKLKTIITQLDDLNH